MKPWQFAGRPIALESAPVVEGEGFTARLIEHGSLEIEMPALNRHRLSIALCSRPNVWTDILGFKSAQHLGPSHANIIPAGQVTWIDDPTPGRCLYIEIDPDCGSRFPGDRLTLPPAFNYYDSRLASISASLWSAFFTSQISNDLFCGTIENEIAITLRQLSHSNISQGRLHSIEAWRKRQLVEFIHAHLHEPMTVGQLAALVDLSAPEFLERFHATFGTPPFRYIALARIRDICRRLAAAEGTPENVARSLGHDPGELESSFMTELGLTMSDYRALRIET